MNQHMTDAPPSPSASPTGRLGLRSAREAAVFFSLLALALAYFLWRGPMRGLELSVDLPSFYSAARAWLFGGDPYDMAGLTRVYAEAGGDAQPVLINVNPPVQFPLLAMLAWLAYPWVKALVVLINVAALGGAVWRLAVVSGLWDRPAQRKWLFVGALFLAPVHTTMSQGQLSLLVLLLVVLTLEAHLRGRWGWAGLCLALAGALKPQMVILFGLYYLLAGRWRACAVAAGVGLGLAALAVGRMEWAGVDWLAGWRGNMDAFVHRGTSDVPGTGYGDFTSDRLNRFIMINLAPLIYPAIGSRWVVNLLAAAVGLLAVGTAARLARARQAESQLHVLAAYALLSVACLLVFYNRTYSATLLILPLALALQWWPTHRRLAIGCVCCIVPFVVPGSAALLTWMGSGDWQHAPALKATVGWLLLPHQTYALLALLGLLLAASWFPIDRSRPPTPHPRP